MRTTSVSHRVGMLPAIIAVVLCVTTVLVPVITAHEPDQYNVAPGRAFADVGPELSRWFFAAIDRGVNKTNEQIRGAVEQKRSQRDLDRLQSQEQLVANVNAEFPYAIALIEDLDAQFLSPKFIDRYPGQLAGYKSPADIKKYLMYPLNPLRAWTCGSFNAYGSWVGSDKIGHFTDMGRHYYNAYAAARRAGKSEQEAMNAAIAVGSGDPIMSESGLLGFWTAGAYSNADMAANFCGMLFYRNLTEPMRLKGADRPPMCERDGPYWRIASHVRPDSDLWYWFVSDHLDETLNPSLYLDFMRDAIRDLARNNTSAIVDYRADANGQRRGPKWFADHTRELRTLWGVKYGHRGEDKDLVMIHEVVFPSAPKDAKQRDAFGRTALHRAVEANDVALVKQLIAAGENVNAPVRSNEASSPDWGQTPLHFAARDGQIEIARTLIAAGANVNALDDHGVTPLHRAIEHPEMIALLCDAGANVKLADHAFRTPLHWAARVGDVNAIDALIARRADVNVPDRDGRTPLFDAAGTGRTDVVAALVRGGADAKVVDQFGATPVHVAVAARGENIASVIDVLARAGAQLNEQDAFGCTPLHSAIRRGDEPIVVALLDRGADANVADAYGATPLHLTAQRGFGMMARMLIDHGANVHARATALGTPIDVAQKRGHDQLAALMRASTGPQALSTDGRRR